MEEYFTPTWLHGLAALLTAAGGYGIGRVGARTRADSSRAAAEHREREQLFQHYNELVQTNREVNHGLRNELAAVRGEIATLHQAHARLLAEAAAERTKCQVENAELKVEVDHLKAEVGRLRRRRPGGDSQG